LTFHHLVVVFRSSFGLEIDREEACMKVLVKKGKLSDQKCDAVIACHFENEKKLSGAVGSLDKASGGLVREVIESGDFKGEKEQVAVVYTRGAIPAGRILLLGLGKKKEFDLEKLRRAFSRAAQRARDLNLKGLAASVDFGEIGQPPGRLAEALVEGVILGLYRFLPYKTAEKGSKGRIRELVILEERAKVFGEVREGSKRGKVLSGAVYFARDLVSTPSNEMTPTILAGKAKEVAKNRGVRVSVLDVKGIKKAGMNAMLGVSRGSHEPAKFIILRYGGAGKKEKPVVVVGKGITFDSGGISLKPAEKMEEMKADMSGGAVVLGVFKAVSELRLPVNLVGLIPATENLPGGGAYKPGDVLRSLSGKTIEIISTDAEGRLLLADALTYAGRFDPAAVVDIATLTGACVIALGEDVIGMLGTDEKLKARIRAAADETGEKLWELPLWEDYAELLKSDVADFKNTGGRAGGAISAAVFLSKFVGKYPWVHLDIAGPAWRKAGKPYIPKGASGIGVRLLVRFLMDRVRGKGQRAKAKG
jgi:leucyl aminopeptidase